MLVWQAPDGAMNPTVSEGVIEEAMERDPSVAASEWLAEFRADIESFITREAVEACVEPGCRSGRRCRACGTTRSATRLVGGRIP